MDVKETPYAAWLEESIGAILAYKPEKIGVCMLMPDGSVCTEYYGGCGHRTKAVMAHEMELDSIMMVAKANAKQILEAAEEN